MNRIAKTGLAVGLGLGIFAAGNISPFKLVEDKPNKDRVSADVADIAKVCGDTALRDALGTKVNHDLTPGKVQRVIQREVNQQAAACIEENIAGPVNTAIAENPAPQVGVDWNLVEASTTTTAPKGNG